MALSHRIPHSVEPGAEPFICTSAAFRNVKNNAQPDSQGIAGTGF